MIRTLAGLVPPWAYATAQQWFSDCVKFGLVTDDELVAHIDKLMPGRALSVRWSGTNADRVATVLAGKETS